MPKSLIQQLYALTIPEIQKVFLQVMSEIVTDRAMLDQMVTAIEANDPEALFRASGFTSAALVPIIERIEKAYKDAAETTVDGWPKRLNTPEGIFRPIFNIRNPQVEDDLRTFSSQWITRVTEEARVSIRETLSNGIARGDSPYTTALDIVGRLDPKTRKRVGGTVGLSENQTRWSINARRYLETNDKRYFQLGLRDKRFDAIVRTAIENEKPLPAKKIEQLITAYNMKAIRQRGETIARTEAMQAINRGEYAAIKQAVNEGAVRQNQINKWWDDTGDGKTRKSHRHLGHKYGRDNPIDMEAPFVTETGARLMYPGDQSLGAPAAEVVNCRCRVRLEVDFLKPFIEENAR